MSLIFQVFTNKRSVFLNIAVNVDRCRRRQEQNPVTAILGKTFFS